MSTSGDTLCSYCHCPIDAGDEAGECPACSSMYHVECWEENDGCAVYGCEESPETEKLEETDIPASYWGQEHKPCPVCSKEILAAARRCKHCGAEFDDARPMEQQEFLEQARLQATLPTTRKAAVIIFVFCVLPCTSLLGAIAGLVWWITHLRQVRALPALHAMFLKGGIVLGILQFTAFVLMGTLHAIINAF